MGRLATVKTLSGFDFSFQPSLDRERILTLAQLGFIGRCEVVHFLGPPGTGKSHLATALGVEAVKAGRSVYFCTLADLLSQLARAEREGRLSERIRFFCRPALLIVDEIGYLPVVPSGGNLSSNWSTVATNAAPWSSPPTAALPSGARCSATRSSPPHCSTGCSTMPSSSRSRAPATGCASTPTSCRSTSDPRPPSPRGRRGGPGSPTQEQLPHRDSLTGGTGENYFGTSGEITIGVDSSRGFRPLPSDRAPDIPARPPA